MIAALAILLVCGVLDRLRGGWPAGRPKWMAHAATSIALVGMASLGTHDLGVLIGAAGRYGNTLKVRPPLCLTEAEADLFADALADSLEELAAA